MSDDESEESSSDAEWGKSKGRSKSRQASGGRSAKKARHVAKLSKEELSALGEKLGKCEAPQLASGLLALIKAHPELATELDAHITS